MWEKVAGQERAVALLQRAARQPLHAYLFVGPRGGGLEDAARCFAADVVAPDGDDRAQDLVLRGMHPDVVEFEPDPDLRDTEQIPLLEPGGIQGFMERDVWPYAPDAWIDPSKTQIGYEISFTRHFYKPKPLRTLAEIRADIEALERETEGLLDEILVG